MELADVAVTTRRVVGRGGGLLRKRFINIKVHRSAHRTTHQGDHGESDEGSDDDTGEHSELILKNLGM